MIDKLGPPIAKAFAPIIKLIGKSHSRNERGIGVGLRDKIIQAAEISFKKDVCKLDNVSKHEIARIGVYQDI